jgi:diguanylate cyclase (GGDEF)-like protein
VDLASPTSDLELGALRIARRLGKTMRRALNFAKSRVGRLFSRKARRYAIPIIFSVCLYILLIATDFYETFYQWSRASEDWQLDEIFIAFVVSSVASLWFFWVRSWDLEQEANRRAIAEAQLSMALEIMHHGLAMFDAQQRLVLCNRRYGEVHEFPPELCRPGTPFTAILKHLRGDGVLAAGAPEDYAATLMDNLRKEGACSTIREFDDGRTVYIVYKPRPDGGWVSTHEDITERRRMERRLNYLAHHDALTGLANRTLLRERLEQALHETRRGENLGLLCLDLDHFKQTNDTLGHPVGDELLKRVAKRLLECVRESDLVARMGGDEFAVLQLSGEQPTAATVLATRIVDVLARPHEIDGNVVTAGTSIGIAVAPADGTNPDQLMKNADLALYRAKGDGRGTYRFFEPDMDRRVHERRELELDLATALKEGQFELYYQPILDLASNKVCCFEALIRWNHPKRGRIPPNEFIPLAEETGQVVQIGEWVLRQACADAARWPKDIQVAVNVSPLQFKGRSIVQTVFSALAAAGLSPNRLELEITENILLDKSEVTLAMLHQLRAIGARIAVDDFGTGYSSLSYFQQFPFDKIKIDRSFVRGMFESPSALAILRAIASLSEALEITTTAEGIETEEQLARIRTKGIKQAQGYLISPPRPIRSEMINPQNRAADSGLAHRTEKWTPVFG